MSAYFDEQNPQEGLGHKSLRGGAISLVARAANAVVQITCVLFLARLLTPEDYGVVAMVTAITGLALVLVDLGTRDAVVQRVRITEGEVSALFWLTAGVGCAFMLAISACGPLIAAFYAEPRLTAIVLWSSPTLLAAALMAQHQALLRRAMMFRELAIVDIAANILSATGAMALAYFGLGYWALVMRPCAMSFLSAAGTWWYCGWLPRKPALTSSVWQMVRFGLNLSGFSLSDFVGRNSDRVVIGRGLGPSVLGYYQGALLIYDNLMGIFVIPLHQVAVAGLSKLQDDLEELRRSWAKALSTVSFYAMPAFGILAITSGDLIVMLLGKKWTQSGLLLSVLALRGIPHSAERTLGWLHVAAGRTDRWLRWGVLATCVQCLALLCGIPFGPFGIVCAYVLSMYMLFIPALTYAGQPLGIGARDVIAALGPQFGGALASAGVGFAFRGSLLVDIPAIERMAILVLLYLIMYLLVVVKLCKVTAPVQVGVSLVKPFLLEPLKWMASVRLRGARN